MLRNRPSKDISFWEVAMTIIFCGASLVSIGIVEWLFNFYSTPTFTYPMGKFIAGLIVLALGYIFLELELMRKEKNGK